MVWQEGLAMRTLDQLSAVFRLDSVEAARLGAKILAEEADEAKVHDIAEIVDRATLGYDMGNIGIGLAVALARWAHGAPDGIGPVMLAAVQLHAAAFLRQLDEE